MKTALPSPHPFLFILAERRRQLGMTHGEIAARAGIAESQVSRALSGKSNPLFTTVAAIAEAVGVPIFEVTR